MSSKEERTLSHQEIWDDTALIQSWDDALAEYKLYHSIHAGHASMEDVVSNSLQAEQITDEATQPDDTINGHDAGKSDARRLDIVEDGEVQETSNGTSMHQQSDQHRSVAKPVSSTDGGLPQHRSVAKPVSSTDGGLPQQLVGQVQDEGLKNLMMSWYYAGYYTGLYEGQQQVKRERHAMERT